MSVMTELNGRRVYTRADMTAGTGVPDATLKKWQRDGDVTGHPKPLGRVSVIARGRALVWDAEEWDAWYQGWTLRPIDREGDPDELIILAEVARVLGVKPTSITMYPKRPPRGWPEPDKVEDLPSGRVRRLYRRRTIWEYADNHRKRGGGGPPAGTQSSS